MDHDVHCDRVARLAGDLMDLDVHLVVIVIALLIGQVS